MSLETVIAENTAALRELIAAISKGVPIAATTVAQVVEKAAETTADAKKPGTEVKESAATASSPSGAALQTTAQEASAPAAETKALTYDDIKTPFLQLIKDKGRDVATGVLKQFGAAKLPDVKPEDFGRVLEAINAAQGEEALA